MLIADSVQMFGLTPKSFADRGEEGGSSRSPATKSHYFLRQTTIFRRFVRSMAPLVQSFDELVLGQESFPHGNGSCVFEITKVSPRER